MKGLTKRQLEVLGFIQDFIQKHRYSPSYREIMSHFAFSSLGSVYKHVHVLKRKGAIAAEKQGRRSMSLPEESRIDRRSEIELPFIGYIAAGSPIEMFSQMQKVAVPEFMVHNADKTYILRARGDSLNDEMIADGDLLIVEARMEARPGEVVVALINQHDTMVKKYFPEENFVRLAGSNPHHQPMTIRYKDIQVQGVVVGIMRFY